MQRLSFLVVFVLAPGIFLNGCWQDAAAPVSDTKYDTRRADKRDKVDSFSTYLTSPVDDSKDEVFKRYLPGKSPGKLKEADFLKAADQANSACDYSAAVVLASEAISLAPSDPYAYYQRARSSIYSKDSDYTQTMADLEKAVDLKYQSSAVYELMARIYDSWSQPEKAIEAMGKAIALQPLKPKLYKIRAALRVASGDKQNALKDYDKWIELAPLDVLPHVLRGQLLESLHENERALAAYKQAYSLPEDRGQIDRREPAFKMRAALLSKLNRRAEAIEELTNGLKQNPNDDEMLRLRGDQYLANEEYEKAIEDYTEAINGAAEFARAALVGRSKAYAAIGKKELAEKDRIEAKKQEDMPAERPL